MKRTLESFDIRGQAYSRKHVDRLSLLSVAIVVVHFDNSLVGAIPLQSTFLATTHRTQRLEVQDFGEELLKESAHRCGVFANDNAGSVINPINLNDVWILDE